MKKIFYILASAIVALGAVACENDVMDNIATVEGDTVSFVAAIDDTKTDLTADNKTIWDEDDTISITWTDAKGERTDVFSNKETGNQNKFTCTADGLAAITEAEVVATYSHNGDGKIDSEAGKAGSLLAYSGAFTELKFQVQNAFLKFTAAEGDVVTLTASEKIFSTTDGTTFNIVATGEAQYVAILPATTTITYAINEVVCTTSKENALAVGKIYNLGTLNAPAATVNGVAYETLAAALEAAAEGATIELLADAGDVTISQACTINAGTYTINITAGEGYAVVDNENGTYTVKALPKVYVCISDVAWTNVNIHLYTNSGDVTEWPGEEISTDLKTNINGKDYYEYTMPSFDTYSIVFNNGTANSNWKLEIKDIEMSEDKYFRLSARGPIVVNPNDVSTFGYAIYVFDQKSKNVAPNLYVWGDNNAFKNTYGTWNYTWGGQSFANDCYYHPADDVNWKHYYYCEIPTSLYSTGFNFIVNKTGQTGDCEPTSITSDLYVGYWYDSASSNGFWTNANMSTPITK